MQELAVPELPAIEVAAKPAPSTAHGGLWGQLGRLDRQGGLYLFNLPLACLKGTRAHTPLITALDDWSTACNRIGLTINMQVIGTNLRTYRAHGTTTGLTHVLQVPRQ